MAKPKATPPVADTVQGGVARIRSLNPAGRRRGGRAFSADPLDIPLAEISEAELAVLQADPQLSVELIV